MKETKKNPNNNLHVYGYINGVRMQDAKEGRTAINLDVASLETFKAGDEFKNKKTYHDVVIFTDDKKVIDKFAAMGKDLEENRARKDEKGFKPAVHTISLDGVIVNKEKSQDLQVMVKDSGFELDVKQADKEVRNRADIVGNIASVKMYEDKNFASVTLMHHYRPEGAEKEFETTIQVRVDGDRKFSQKTYEALKKGELGVGDFIRVGGQLHNNNFENEKGKVYSMALDLTSSELLHKKGEKAEVKAETKTEKKPEAKKEAKTEKKKAVSRKKGVKMA